MEFGFGLGSGSGLGLGLGSDACVGGAWGRRPGANQRNTIAERVLGLPREAKAR